MWKYFLLILPLFFLVDGKTVRYELQTCDGAERKIVASRLVAGEIRGIIECRYAPQNTRHAMMIRVNSLNLARSEGKCPSLKIIAYTNMRDAPDLEEDDFIKRVDRRIKIPEDPKTIANFDCNNYKEFIGKTLQTEQLGQKIQLNYDTKVTSERRRGGFDFTVTSYTSEGSYKCEANQYRCWTNRYVCIDSSLECDLENNCNDGSDEDNFKCTGRIAGLQLPLFIIIIVLIIILIVAVIVGLVLYQRRRRREREARRARPIMDDPRQMQPLYTHDPSIVPPEASIAPSSSHQYSAYGPNA